MRTKRALGALLTYRLHPETMKHQGASFMKTMITGIELQQLLGEHKAMRNRPDRVTKNKAASQVRPSELRKT
jgi:hypothetical protein